MTLGLAKESKMVTILTIHRMHSPWQEQEVLRRQELSRRLGEVGVSHCGLPVSCHLGKSPKIGKLGSSCPTSCSTEQCSRCVESCSPTSTTQLRLGTGCRAFSVSALLAGTIGSTGVGVSTAVMSWESVRRSSAKMSLSQHVRRLPRSSDCFFSCSASPCSIGFSWCSDFLRIEYPWLQHS